LSNRRSIYVEGLSHGDNPIPLASVVGNVMYSGNVNGRVRVTRAYPDTFDEQVANMFYNMTSMLEVAGGTLEDVVQIAVLIGESSDKDAFNAEWARRFPDPASRPSRKNNSGKLRDGCKIECQFIAVLGT
jgi:2-iminobutanoate/2-iminopropanoate deaminase